MTDKRHWTRFNMMREDPPAWALSVKLSLVGGLSYLAFIRASTMVGKSGYVVNIIVSGLVLCLTSVIAPAWAALRAQRFYMWYGFLPFSLAIPWFVAVYIYNLLRPLKVSGGAGGFDETNMTLIIGAVVIWLLSAGPVSAVKYSVELARRRAVAQAAALEADMKIDIAGSWPPKPTATAQPESDAP